MSIRAVHHLNCGTMCPVGGFLLGQGGLGRGAHYDDVDLFCAHDPAEFEALCGAALTRGTPERIGPPRPGVGARRMGASGAEVTLW